MANQSLFTPKRSSSRMNSNQSDDPNKVSEKDQEHQSSFTLKM